MKIDIHEFNLIHSRLFMKNKYYLFIVMHGLMYISQWRFMAIKIICQYLILKKMIF